MHYKKYSKKFDFSYTYGVSPTLELTRKRPDLIRVILIHPDGQSNSGVIEIKKICDANQIKYEIAPKAIQKISVKDNTYAIGVFNKYEKELSASDNHVVLVNPSSPGNLGTIIRSIVGFNFNNLAIIRPAVDIFDPKTLRAAMGSTFDLNFEYFDSFEKYHSRFQEHNLYPFMLEASTNIKEISWEAPFSLVFGNESSGLSENFANMGTPVYIPHSKNIDSLNLSIASSIGMFCASQ